MKVRRRPVPAVITRTAAARKDRPEHSSLHHASGCPNRVLVHVKIIERLASHGQTKVDGKGTSAGNRDRSCAHCEDLTTRGAHRKEVEGVWTRTRAKVGPIRRMARRVPRARLPRTSERKPELGGRQGRPWCEHLAVKRQQDTAEQYKYASTHESL